MRLTNTLSYFFKNTMRESSEMSNLCKRKIRWFTGTFTSDYRKILLVVRKCLKSPVNTLKMNLYYFNPNNYDMTYTVMAKNTEEAKILLLNHLFNIAKKDPFDIRNDGETYESFEMKMYHTWKNAFDLNILPKGYTIDEYKEGEVLIGEIC